LDFLFVGALNVAVIVLLRSAKRARDDGDDEEGGVAAVLEGHAEELAVVADGAHERVDRDLAGFFCAARRPEVTGVVGSDKDLPAGGDLVDGEGLAVGIGDDGTEVEGGALLVRGEGGGGCELERAVDDAVFVIEQEVAAADEGDPDVLVVDVAALKVDGLLEAGLDGEGRLFLLALLLLGASGKVLQEAAVVDEGGLAEHRGRGARNGERFQPGKAIRDLFGRDGADGFDGELVAFISTSSYTSSFLLFDGGGGGGITSFFCATLVLFCGGRGGGGRRSKKRGGGLFLLLLLLLLLLLVVGFRIFFLHSGSLLCLWDELNGGASGDGLGAVVGRLHRGARRGGGLFLFDVGQESLGFLVVVTFDVRAGVGRGGGGGERVAALLELGTIRVGWSRGCCWFLLERGGELLLDGEGDAVGHLLGEGEWGGCRHVFFFC
jgi:hypothetical protein